LHKISYTSKNSSAQLLHLLTGHTCKGCPKIIQVFNIVRHDAEKTRTAAKQKSDKYRKKKSSTGEKPAKKRLVRKKTSEALGNRRHALKAKYSLKKQNKDGETFTFPPEPPTIAVQDRTVREMCECFNPESIEESGCAVCGLLTPNYELTNKDDLDLDWNLLAKPGVTRLERDSLDCPIEEQEGPILDEDCDKVCTDCEDRLLRGIVPLKSLADHIWIGRVPWQLQDLSFAEKMLISRVRHNRCVIRVASGRGKLSANAIMFNSLV
ncbi:hypothetical protein B0H11DRAFT_1660674, partial [Mycena galericulata]